MRKPKVTCFRYKRYNDIYVSNVYFSSDVLLSILDIFPNQKIIVLIESDPNYVQILSLIGKSIGIAEVMPRSHVPRFLATCNKMELYCLLNRVNLDDFEGMFIAGINNKIIPEEFICSFYHTANSMVKNGMSDISISINFSENQMEISLSKEKYEVRSVKDKIYNIFWGDRMPLWS